MFVTFGTMVNAYIYPYALAVAITGNNLLLILEIYLLDGRGLISLLHVRFSFR